MPFIVCESNVVESKTVGKYAVNIRFFSVAIGFDLGLRHSNTDVVRNAVNIGRLRQRKCATVLTIARHSVGTVHARTKCFLIFLYL